MDQKSLKSNIKTNKIKIKYRLKPFYERSRRSIDIKWWCPTVPKYRCLCFHEKLL